MTKKEITVVGIILLLVAAGAVWYVMSSDSSPAPAPSAGQVFVPTPTTQTEAVSTSSLGASLLDKAQNPLQDKVPEFVPAPNPIKDAYKNPFE